MLLESIRDRVQPLRELEDPTTIELQRVATFDRLVDVSSKLETFDQFLAAEKERWERDKAKCNTAAKLRNLRRYPVEPKYIAEDRQLARDLAIELGEIPEEFTCRVRPALPPIVFPDGPKFQFPAFHTWLHLPPVTADVKYARGKGPGENEINALMGAIPPKGGRCDHALPGGETAETKATDDNTFRGGAHSRRNINRVRRRIERIIDIMPDLIKKAGKRLSDQEVRKLEWVVRLLNNVNASLEYGNMHLGDWQEFYSVIEILNHLDWNGTPSLYREDQMIRDPEGIYHFCRYVSHTMKGSESFFTDYIFLVRPVDRPTQYLVIPKADYDKTVKFLNMSKGDAHFKYFQPASMVTPMKIGLVPGAYKPYHAGHDAIIRLAAQENDRVTVFVSLSDRDNISGKAMERIWQEQIVPSLPDNVAVVYGGSPVGKVFELLGHANDDSSRDIFSIYSDPSDANRFDTLPKYAGTLVANGQIKTRAIERSSTVDVSGTQMRHWLANGDKAQFVKNLPNSIDGEAVWALLLGGVSTS